MKHILILNQHGENRGDEAAMRAMLRMLEQALGEVRFTLLYQFRDRNLRPPVGEQVDTYPIVVPPLHYLGLLAFTLGKLVGLEPTLFLPRNMRGMIQAYRSADLVISAPGGPYFGDIYADHELVHWWYVWLGHLFAKPLCLYAPSAGPFKIGWLNRVRHQLFRRFSAVAVREELSARNLRELLGEDFPVRVTADSALQWESLPCPRGQYFAGERRALRDRFLVAVSLNDYAYPGVANPEDMRQGYRETMTVLLCHLAAKRDCHFLFLPQLYGGVHSDLPFLESVGGELPDGVSWELVYPKADSDSQRSLFAMCDLHIASRYHPAIFGNSARVPGLCIYYEHKALGFMRQLGLERFAVDIRDLNTEKACDLIDELLTRREELVAHLGRRIPLLQEKARETTEMVVSLVEAGPDARGRAARARG